MHSNITSRTLSIGFDYCHYSATSTTAEAVLEPMSGEYMPYTRAGYAVTYTVPPDVDHADEYLAAEREARAVGRGLWRQDQAAISLDVEGTIWALYVVNKVDFPKNT